MNIQTRDRDLFENLRHITHKCQKLYTTELDKYFVKLANSSSEKEDAYRLRYEAYLSKGHITHNVDRSLHDEFDNGDLSKTVLIYKNNVAIASARLCFSDMNFCHSHGLSLPSAKVFPKSIEAILKQEKKGEIASRAVEVTKLVRSAECVSSPGITFILFRYLSYLILDFKPAILFAAVCDNHVPFYRRIGFDRVSEPRFYPGLDDVQGTLLACRRATHARIQKFLPSALAARPNDDQCQRFIRGEVIEISSEKPPTQSHIGLVTRGGFAASGVHLAEPTRQSPRYPFSRASQALCLT